MVQWALQKMLGYEPYLFVFSNFKVFTLRKDQSEKDFFRFLDLLDKKANILDLGANIGIMTVHMSRYTQGKVLAVEPEPSNIRVLKKMISFHQLHNVQVEETAVGAEEGEITMVLPVISEVKKQGLSHVKKANETGAFDQGIEFKVPVVCIDQLPFVQHYKIGGIKIDIENYEYEALLGARALLQRDRPVVYAELWENDNRRNCFDLFKTLNYQIQVWDGVRLVTFNPDQHHTQNFFFIP